MRPFSPGRHRFPSRPAPVGSILVNPAELAAVLLDLVRRAAAERGADPDSITAADVTLERPRNRDHGDWASNVAMQARQAARRAPARARRRARRRSSARSTASPPSTSPAPASSTSRSTRRPPARSPSASSRRARATGTGSLYAGVAINLEFVSANPTGPDPHRRHPLGGGRRQPRPHLRGAGRTGHPRVLLQRPRRADRPVRAQPARRPPRRADARGRLRRRLHRRHRRARRRRLPGRPRRAAARRAAGGVPRARRRPQCSARSRRACTTSASTSTSTSTRTRCTSPAPSSARSQRLRELGHIYEADGATWLRTTEFGDDRDRVVIKSDGEPAYIAGDLAYYLNKRERGFDRSLIMLGADHHGYVGGSWR